MYLLKWKNGSTDQYAEFHWELDVLQSIRGMIALKAPIRDLTLDRMVPQPVALPRDIMEGLANLEAGGDHV